MESSILEIDASLGQSEAADLERFGSRKVYQLSSSFDGNFFLGLGANLHCHLLCLQQLLHMWV